MTSVTNVYATGLFWERLWRQSGILSASLFVIAYAVTLYAGGRVQILIAAVIASMAILNLLWFAAAIRTTLAETGQDGWGAAVTASSAALGGVSFIVIAASAALAHSLADSESQALTSGLTQFAWAGVVLSSFPRAMLIMASTFGFWRAGLISNPAFVLGVAAVVLVLLGGTTWLSSGFWSPDGTYSRIVSPIIGIAWILVVSRILLSQAPATLPKW